MSRRRTSSRREGFWAIAKLVGVLGIIALVLGYLYGSMAFNFLQAQEEPSGRGLLKFFGFELKSLITVDRDPELDAPAFGESPPGSTQSSQSDPDSDNAAVVEALTLYRLQLGSFGQRENAEQLQGKLAEAGYPVFVTANPPYRVWAGIGTSEESLQGLADALRAEGFEVYIGPLDVAALDLSGLATSQSGQALAKTLAYARQVLVQGTQLWLTHTSGDIRDGSALKNLEEIVSSLSTVSRDVDDVAGITQEDLLLLESTSEKVAASLRDVEEPPLIGHQHLFVLFEQYQQLVNALNNK